MNNFNDTTKLFANPSFIQGTASVLDIGGTLQEYNATESEKVADSTAIQSDWQAVGNDIKAGIASYEQDSSTTK